MNLASPWKLLAAVMVVVAAAAFCVVLLTHDLISQLSTGTNEAEHRRNYELVETALNSAKTQLEKLAVDNATWDDAVRHGYGVIDLDWVDETWGSSTNIENRSYDRMLLIDGLDFKILADFRSGKSQSTPLDLEMLKNIKGMIARLPADNLTSGSVSAYVQTSFGEAIMAIAPIVSVSEGLRVTQSKPNYFVLVKEFDQGLVEAISRQIKIEGIAFAGYSKGQLQLQSETGAPLLSLQWQDANSGTAIGSSVQNRANSTILFLLIAMSAIGLCCWYFLNKTLQNEAQAKHDALHDPLTGLPNRNALAAGLQALFATPQRNFAIVFVDLDGFKEVNDTFGHHLGDEVIRTIARGLGILAKDARIVCRMGGDEFVVLFVGKDAQNDCTKLAKNLISFVAQPFDFDGRIAAVGASIGIACPTENTDGAGEILRRADIAMYRAKALGKNQYCAYNPSFDADRQINKDIESELTSVLRERRLEVVFQPIVDAKTGEMICVEALARWPKDAARQLSPDKFVRVAELSGQIDELGDLILHKACIAARQWGTLGVAVNISPLQLNNPQFSDRALAIIQSAGIDPRRIEFEITENVLIENVDRTRCVLEHLQSHGIKIAVDDFGSGYSSIGYLRQFKLDRVKLDRSISAKVTKGNADQKIIQGIMLVAQGLGASVTAEGVEKAEEVSLLRLAGCSSFQGYYFHRPLAADAVTNLLFQSESTEDCLSNTNGY